MRFNLAKRVAQCADDTLCIPDVRLKKFAEEKQELQNDVQALQQQLKDMRTKGRKYSAVNGSLDDDDYEDAQSKASAATLFISILNWFCVFLRRSQ